ncbi:MAG: hypothetical protein GQ531_04615, partial [Sulfurovum sp.]|nr:hypothetical protein [Sulfurovum sp.]
MDIPNFYEEIIVFGLLLLAVFGVYILLKVHYHFAFGLMKNTASYEKNKSKIVKAKQYLFFVLKVLLWIGLISMATFGIQYLSEGMSLKALILELWAKIPEGFWQEALFVIMRIVVIITLSRYVLKFVYAFLDKQEEKILLKKRYNSDNVEMVYLRLHNSIKFTVVLGVVYRIIHFFPFLLGLSHVFLFALIAFIGIASLIT